MPRRKFRNTEATAWKKDFVTPLQKRVQDVFLRFKYSLMHLPYTNNRSPLFAIFNHFNFNLIQIGGLTSVLRISTTEW